MTLPSQIIFPEMGSIQSVEDVKGYLTDYTFTLQRMYEDLAQGINGDIRGDAFIERQQWIPTLEGTSTPGTFTYNHQIGWTLRRGIINDIWFDIQWSASGSAAGNLFIVLPYEVANSEQIPFSSDIQSSNVAYGAGKTVLSINAIPNTFRGEIWSSGSGAATSNLAVPSSGRLIGSLRYMGKQNEP